MRVGEAGPTTAPELVAFTHWSAIKETVAEVLTDALEDRFTWPLVRQHLDACGLLVGPAAI
jgi:hypothetical protein